MPKSQTTTRDIRAMNRELSKVKKELRQTKQNAKSFTKRAFLMCKNHEKNECSSGLFYTSFAKRANVAPTWGHGPPAGSRQRAFSTKVQRVQNSPVLY